MSLFPTASVESQEESGCFQEITHSYSANQRHCRLDCTCPKLYLHSGLFGKLSQRTHPAESGENLNMKVQLDPEAAISLHACDDQQELPHILVNLKHCLQGIYCVC